MKKLKKPSSKEIITAETDDAKLASKETLPKPSILKDFSNLACPDPQTRIKCAESLLECLTSTQSAWLESLKAKNCDYSTILMKYKQRSQREGEESTVSSSLTQAHWGDDILCQEAAYTLKRLIRGLSSDRDGARQGFCLALTGFLSMPRSLFPVSLGHLLDLSNVYINPSFATSKSEKKQFYFARLFLYSSIVSSTMLNYYNSSSDKDNNNNIPELCHFFKSLVQIQTHVECLREATLNLTLQFLTKMIEINPSCKKDLLGVVAADLKNNLNNNIDCFYFGTLLDTAADFPLPDKDVLQTSTYCFPRVHPVWSKIAATNYSSSGKLNVFWKKHVEDTLLLPTASHQKKATAIKLLEIIPFSTANELLSILVNTKNNSQLTFTGRFILNALNMPKNLLHNLVIDVLSKLAANGTGSINVSAAAGLAIALLHLQKKMNNSTVVAEMIKTIIETFQPQQQQQLTLQTSILDILLDSFGGADLMLAFIKCIPLSEALIEMAVKKFIELPNARLQFFLFLSHLETVLDNSNKFRSVLRPSSNEPWIFSAAALFFTSKKKENLGLRKECSLKAKLALDFIKSKLFPLFQSTEIFLPCLLEGSLLSLLMCLIWESSQTFDGEDESDKEEVINEINSSIDQILEIAENIVCKKSAGDGNVFIDVFLMNLSKDAVYFRITSERLFSILVDLFLKGNSPLPISEKGMQLLVDALKKPLSSISNSEDLDEEGGTMMEYSDVSSSDDDEDTTTSEIDETESIEECGNEKTFPTVSKASSSDATAISAEIIDNNDEEMEKFDAMVSAMFVQKRAALKAQQQAIRNQIQYKGKIVNLLEKFTKVQKPDHPELLFNLIKSLPTEIIETSSTVLSSSPRQQSNVTANCVDGVESELVSKKKILKYSNEIAVVNKKFVHFMKSLNGLVQLKVPFPHIPKQQVTNDKKKRKLSKTIASSSSDDESLNFVKESLEKVLGFATSKSGSASLLSPCFYFYFKILRNSSIERKGEEEKTDEKNIDLTLLAMPSCSDLLQQFMMKKNSSIPFSFFNDICIKEVSFGWKLIMEFIHSISTETSMASIPKFNICLFYKLLLELIRRSGKKSPKNIFDSFKKAVPVLIKFFSDSLGLVEFNNTQIREPLQAICVFTYKVTKELEMPNEIKEFIQVTLEQPILQKNEFSKSKQSLMKFLQ